MNKELYTQIINKIKEANNILIITHENPDGDAIGSACVMAELAGILDKNFDIFCHDEPEPAFYFYLTQIKLIMIKIRLIFKNRFSSRRRLCSARKVKN